jgi:hypothetical protein
MIFKIAFGIVLAVFILWALPWIILLIVRPFFP